MTELPDDVKDALDHLLALIHPLPPPAHAAGSPEVMNIVRDLPSDLVHLASSYGAGAFRHQRLGCLVEIYDPFSPEYATIINDAHALLSEYRDVEGDEMVPHPVHPASPGLRIWGGNDKGDMFLWLTEGQPGAWPVMYFGDMRKMIRYDMPVVVFLERLFTGQIARAEFGYGPGPDDRLNPADISFDSWR